MFALKRPMDTQPSQVVGLHDDETECCMKAFANECPFHTPSPLPFACCPPSEPMFKCRVAVWLSTARPDGKPHKMGKCDRLSRRVQWTMHV